MGRKAISGVPKSKTPLRMLLTDDERALLDRAAAIAGKPTSTWGRDSLLTLAAEVIAAHEKPTPPAKPSRKRKA